jgi:RHS repeat-associated protein
VLFEKIVYGEGHPNDQALNLRTRIFQRYDAAGVIQDMVADPITAINVAYDFKGNLLGSSRQFVQDCKALPDWSKAAPLFLADIFVSTTQYDALNRVIAARSPDASITRPTYNLANLLETVSVNLLGTAVATSFLGNIVYNAKGQRVLIQYGDQGAPSAATAYTYDPLTFRLDTLTTTRPGFPAAKQPAQALSYTYDPTGNITHIADGAQQTIYFNNQIVLPDGDYTYDAIYRLTLASGREQLGLSGGHASPPWSTSYNDLPRIHLPHPGDGNAMGTYREQYQYDNAGNFLKLIHTGSNPANPGWTRSYTYNEASLLEPGKVSNRLTSTNVGGSATWNEPYTYDLHGNTTSMPQLQSMQWDFKDQMLMTQRQAVNPQDGDGILHQGERTYYVYNAAGERVRKTTESAQGVKTKERFYLGTVEVYREYDGAGNTKLERQTLHIMDDKQRIALVETPKGGASAIRFQFDNHLGTACLELDNTGAVITYEEYYPYGSTSYQAGRSVAEVSLKRYRYTGKERDEESGLYYQQARYCASWVCRWISCDPAGLVDGVNLYTFVRNNPMNLADATGKLSWGKVLGFAAAIVVGVAVTALTGGVAGPIVAGVIGGALAGATGEIVEAAVDGRPITLKNVVTSAVVGGIFGGLFAGAGEILANTQIGQRLVARVASSGIGQAVGRAIYKVATSPSRAAVAARAVSGVVREGVETLEKVGEGVGRRLGGRFAANAEAQAERRLGLQTAQADAASRAGGGVQATLQGEANGQPYYATTRSGVDRSGTGVRAIETPQGRVQAPTPDAVSDVLTPTAVPGGSGQVFPRGADAEFKLFGHTLLSTGRNSTGRLYLGVTAPSCPSCSANLWNLRTAIPGLQIISDMPAPISGAAGAGQTFIPFQHEELPPPVPALQLEGHF